MTEPVPFFQPAIGEEEIAEVSDTLRSGWLTTGPKTARLESSIRDLAGAQDAVATSSGTAALHLALLAIGAGPGDEVITTALTCAATVNVIAATGATPVLADVCPDTLNLDARKAEAAVTGRTVAVLPVHYAGHPCAMGELAQMAHRHGLVLIEDAAHALGAALDGRPVGSTADLTAFSFYATKLMTTGEGGMLVGRTDLVERARSLASHGEQWEADDRRSLDAEAWRDVVQPGLKYRMSDVQASLGLPQFAKLDGFLRRRREIAEAYVEALAETEQVELPTVRPGARPSWHLFTLRTRPRLLSIGRDEFVRQVRLAGGNAARQFRPIYREPYYRDRFPGAHTALPVTENEAARVLSLPVHPRLTERAQARVVDAVVHVARRFGAEVPRQPQRVEGDLST
ncbi:DegT/DnrJ/EryC1/StrS family aminotransferase [Streptomyces sulphureus]|uniref:DegT/DnrJ/EryC1/StrS family aminotransferase n=1 Tax=Streptomyces sulphureus TaxID=47758 RepID=UPI00036FFE4C|nr:DegT/DnrJ/EryC1/StrS aminotransferase family protein [Streptomyces sulphureus]